MQSFHVFLVLRRPEFPPELLGQNVLREMLMQRRHIGVKNEALPHPLAEEWLDQLVGGVEDLRMVDDVHSPEPERKAILNKEHRVE